MTHVIPHALRDSLAEGCDDGRFTMAMGVGEREAFLAKLKKLSQWKKEDLINEAALPPEELSAILWQAFRDGLWGELIEGSGKMREEHELLASYPQAASPEDVLAALKRFEEDYLWHDIDGWSDKGQKLFDHFVTERPDAIEGSAELFEGWMGEMLELSRFRAGRVSELSDAVLRRIAAKWVSDRYDNRFIAELLPSLPSPRFLAITSEVAASGDAEVYRWEVLEQCLPHATPEQAVRAAVFYRGDDRQGKALSVARAHVDVAIPTLEALVGQELDWTVSATLGIVLATLLQDAGREIPSALDELMQRAVIWCSDEHDLELARSLFARLEHARAVNILGENLSKRGMLLFDTVFDESLVDKALAMADRDYMQAHIIAGFTVAGERVLPKLCAVAARKKPGIGEAVVAAGALAEIPKPEAAEAAVLLLGHTSKAVREAAETALVKLGEVARAALEKGSQSKKKAVREICAATLERIGAAAASAGSPLGQLDAKLTKELSAKIIARLDEGVQASQQDQVAEALVNEHGALFFAATRDWFVQGMQSDSYYRVGSAWTAALGALETPGDAAWPALDAFAQLPKSLASYKLRQLPDALTKRFGAESAAAASLALSVHPAGLRETLFAIAATDGKAQRATLLEGLGDSSKAVRGLCVDGLGAAGEDVVADLLPLLAEKKKAVRQAAADALGKIGSGKASEALAQALDAEKADDVRTSLEDALRACGGGHAEADYPADAAGWQALLAGQKKARLPKFIDVLALPALGFKSGEMLSGKALENLLAKVVKEDADRTDPLLWALRPHLDDAQAEAFSLALKDQWAKSGGKAKDKWAVFQQAIFCSEQRLHTIAPRLEEVTEAGQHHLAGWYLSVCVRHGSQAGRDWVGYWVDNATKDGLLTKAIARLEEIAQQQGKSVAEVKASLNPHVHDEVAEAQIPTLGFDAHGQLELSYGPRQITVRLTAAGDLSTESEGKVASSLPRAKKDDDPAAVSAAKDRFKAAQKELKAVSKQIIARLERAMIVGRDWTGDRFRALFLEHPLVSQIGTGLVFACGEQLFRVSDERELIDVDGEPVALPEAATIRLAHPLEIDADRRQAWLAHIDDASVVQPFDQLSRPLFAGTDEEALPEETLAPATFVRRCRDAGWLRGSPQDAGLVYEEWFKLPARGVVVELNHSGYAVSDLGWGDEIEIRSLSFTSLDGKHLRPGDVDPIAFSEARLAVQRIVG